MNRKKTIIPTNILMGFITLLSNKQNLDESSSVPLITFGYKVKEPLYTNNGKIEWINGVFISMYGTLCFTIGDDDSEYTDDIEVSEFPLHLIKAYLKRVIAYTTENNLRHLI